MHIETLIEKQPVMTDISGFNEYEVSLSAVPRKLRKCHDDFYYMPAEVLGEPVDSWAEPKDRPDAHEVLYDYEIKPAMDSRDPFGILMNLEDPEWRDPL